MNRVTKLILLIFYISTSHQLLCQDQKEKDKSKTHFITGVGGSYVNVIDQGISPLLYNGIGGNVLLGHFHENAKGIHTSYAKFDFNQASSEISNAEMYTFRLEGHFQKYWKIDRFEDKKWRIKPGFDLSAKWALRQHLNYTNNSQHIETRFSLSPAMMLEREFQLWSREFEFGLFAGLPLLTYATRPIFASTRYPASIDRGEVKFFDYLQNGEILSLGSYFRYFGQYYLYYPFKNGNGLRLDYFWSYESYKALNPIRTGEHSLMISTFFKI